MGIIMTTTKYELIRLQKLEDFTPMVIHYIISEGPKISELFDNKLNWENTPVIKLADKFHFYICKRNGEITGHFIAALTFSPLDPTVKVFRQWALYAKPDSGRTAYHLFQKFIDIGKKEANHIITMLTSRTNIKPSTLENMGFKELETLYRMEIK